MFGSIFELEGSSFLIPTLVYSPPITTVRSKCTKMFVCLCIAQTDLYSVEVLFNVLRHLK